MATAPSDPPPILGRVDRHGRLVAADPELERLQVEAGSSVGATLALPQLAAVARLAQRLRIPVSRRVLAAGSDQDVDMWVRATVEGEEVALAIDRWTVRAALPPRLDTPATVDHERLSPQPLAWSADEHLRLVAVAAPLAELLGIEPRDAAGQPLTKLIRLEESESGEMPILDALASRTAFAGQRATARSTGRALVLDGRPSESHNGLPGGFEGVAMPEPVAGTAAAARPTVDPAIESALAMPLDHIVRSAEGMIAATGERPRPEYAAYASDIAAAARHLLSVIRSLAAETRAPGCNAVNLTELALEAVGLVETAASERQIAVCVEPAGRLLARADPRSVIQILINLIGNAIRYSPPGTAVTVSFDQSEGSALVHVTDQGPGIDPDDQERVFEAFHKGSPTGEGSGLGLAIARRLAREMGGEIRLKSAPGEGARFTLQLPAA